MGEEEDTDLELLHCGQREVTEGCRLEADAPDEWILLVLQPGAVT